MMDLTNLGSQTAKNGFRNEDDIIYKFNNWKTDNEAKLWLEIMQYNLAEIEFVKAVKLSGFKTDVQVQVTIKLKEAIDSQNIQVKLVSNIKGFNQIDKRWVNKYVELWNMPKEIENLLKIYTGEIKPNISNPRDKRRMFADEFSSKNKEIILKWLNENARWMLKPINYCLNFFGNGEISITERGNFKIGKITMQRKGSDAGRLTANMLQFKINPAELFN